MRHNHSGQEATQPRQALSLGEDKPVRPPSGHDDKKSLAWEDRSYSAPLSAPPSAPPTPPYHSGAGAESPPSLTCLPAHTL